MLYYNTVTPLLLSVLKTLMISKEFDSFRLVGGTALSLYKGHRESVDIDLFTDAEYGSIDFASIDKFLRATYSYVHVNHNGPVGMGVSYQVGETPDDSVKLDVYYSTESFIDEAQFIDDIRFASIEEIVAMKIDVVSRQGRKKDFWDLHELTEMLSFDQMLALHKRRHPYTYDSDLIKKNFSDFTKADEEPDPVCLRGKFWELIKSDMIDFANKK